MLIGYARVSTADQGPTIQKYDLDGRAESGMDVDHGLSGTHRLRQGLREAMVVVHAGHTLAVTTLDRFSRLLPGARDLAAEPTSKGVTLHIGSSAYDPEIRLVVCCSTLWVWSPSSALMWSACVLVRAWP